MSAKRLPSKGIRGSVGCSENPKVVLSEKKDSNAKNLVTAAAHRLFSKSCKNEKENVSQTRSKPELLDKGKESKAIGKKTSGTLCPAAPKNDKINSIPGGKRKGTVLTTTETAGGLVNRPKPDTNKPGTSLNSSKQNEASSLDIQIDPSKLSQPGLGKSGRITGRSEPKLCSTSDHPTSNKLAERVNGISRIPAHRHSTKCLSSKSKLVTSVSHDSLRRSNSTTFTGKKLPAKQDDETLLNTKATSDRLSREVGKSLKPNVDSDTVSPTAVKPLGEEAVTHPTRSACPYALNCGSHVQKISGHSSGQETVIRTEPSLESDLIHNSNLTRCLSVDSATRKRICPHQAERSMKIALEDAGLNNSSSGSTADEADGMCSVQKLFFFDPVTCEICEDDDCLDKTMTEQRYEGDSYGDDPFADVTLIPDSSDSEVFAKPSSANHFRPVRGGTVDSYSGQRKTDGYRSNGFSVSETSEGCPENVSAETRKTLLRHRRHLWSVDSRRSGRSQSAIFAALGDSMPDPQKTEEPQLIRCGDRMHVGGVETEIKSVAGKSTTSEASGCSTEASSGLEAGWSTVLRNCEKNIPLTSFVPYTQRLSMLQDHAASQHPLDILTDPGRKNPDGNSENIKSPVFPDTPSESVGILPARPLLRTRLSSGSDTVGSRTSSESNLPSVRERISVADVMTPGFDGVKDPSKEIHELMSAGFLPKRPLSQICSRTINASNVWKMGNSTLSEGLPHYHAPNSACISAASNPWKSACNISAQIQAARSCSKRVLSPLLNSGVEKRGSSSFPFDVSSAGSSGLCSSASISANSQVSSSLEPSPTHTALSIAVGSIPIENGARSRLSSFDRDFHLSSLAARSRSSSFVSSVEEKQAVVIRKLRHELELANEKITSLMTQSNMNVVLATTYEQNVESMSQRNKHLVTLLEEKNLEVQKLRSSMIGFGSCDGDLKNIPNSANLECSRRKSSSVCNFPMDSKATEVSFSRQISSDSLNSESSACSAASQPCNSNGIIEAAKKKSKKNWIRKSLSRAFSGKQKRAPFLSVELDTASIDSSPFNSDPALEEKPSAPVVETDAAAGCNTASRTFHENTIAKLKKQLSERDAELMDLKLEALSSVQQVEQLRATVVQLKKEIASQKADQADPKRQLLTPRPSLPTIEKAPTAGKNVRKTSVASGANLAVDTTMSPDISIDGYPRLTSQESFIFSSPKFLQKFSLKSAITSVSIDDCFLPTSPLKAVSRTGSHRECRSKDTNRNHCHVKPKATLSVDSYSAKCDSDFGDGIGRKTSSPLPTASPSPSSTQSDVIRRKDANGYPKSGNSSLLQSVI